MFELDNDNLFILSNEESILLGLLTGAYHSLGSIFSV